MRKYTEITDRVYIHELTWINEQYRRVRSALAWFPKFSSNWRVSLMSSLHRAAEQQFSRTNSARSWDIWATDFTDNTARCRTTELLIANSGWTGTAESESGNRFLRLALVFVWHWFFENQWFFSFRNFCLRIGVHDAHGGCVRMLTVPRTIPGESFIQFGLTVSELETCKGQMFLNYKLERRRFPRFFLPILNFARF